MFTVHQITKQQAQSFIRTHKLEYFYNEGYEGTKYEFSYNNDSYLWYGVFDGDQTVAVQVINVLSDTDIELMCIEKIKGIGHGVFETVMDYFSDKNLHLETFDKKLQKMYEGLGFKKIEKYKYYKLAK